MIKERKRFDFALKNIINMDETPMCFDMPGNTTMDKVGSKTVSVKTTGHERQHFTVVLACQADGKKFVHWLSLSERTCQRRLFHQVLLLKFTQKDGWMKL